MLSYTLRKLTASAFFFVCTSSLSSTKTIFSNAQEILPEFCIDTRQRDTLNWGHVNGENSLSSIAEAKAGCAGYEYMSLECPHNNGSGFHAYCFNADNYIIESTDGDTSCQETPCAKLNDQECTTTISNDFYPQTNCEINKVMDGYYLGSDHRGAVYEVNPSPVPSIDANDGDAVRCAADDTIVYRYTLSGGSPVLKGYPSPAIADSCDDSWRDPAPEVVDCAGIAVGSAQTWCQTVGASVKCSADSDTVYTYTLTDGGAPELRGFRSQAAATSCDPDWRNFEIIDCTGIPVGLPREPCGTAVPGLATGSAVKCIVAENADIVFNYVLKTDGTPELYKFPTQAIADSCIPDWRTSKVLIDCYGIPVADTPQAECSEAFEFGNRNIRRK